MCYVYLIRSISNSERIYIGFTKDLKDRIKKHNAHGSPHTSQYAPWKLVTYLGFKNEPTARRFERYLKSSSGRAFAKKRLW